MGCDVCPHFSTGDAASTALCPVLGFPVQDQSPDANLEWMGLCPILISEIDTRNEDIWNSMEKFLQLLPST